MQKVGIWLARTSLVGRPATRPTGRPPLELLRPRRQRSRGASTLSLPVQLRDYQEECIQSVLDHLKKGHNRLGVSLATGSGKTVIFTQLIDRIDPPSDNVTKSLILVHRKELVEQAAHHCERAYPGKSIEIEMGSSMASGNADITVASIRSLVSSDRIKKFDPTKFKLVLVDEAHHAVAPSYLTTFDYFGLSKANRSQCALVGVSATMSRLDGLKLGAVMDHIVYHKDYVDMIDAKWLSKVLFTTVRSNADLKRVRSGRDGDFQTKPLSEAVNTEEINTLTVGAWMTEARERKSTMVFCVDLDHVEGLTSAFRKHGINAQYIMGSTPSRLRSERLEAFRNRKFPVLINCGIFTEGTDIPNIDCVLLARPTRSRNLLVQKIGRGMRLFPGKDDCLVIDMVASLETGIVTAPTLFGLDPSELVEKQSPVGMAKLSEARRHDFEKDESGNSRSLSEMLSSDVTLTMTRYDSVLELIGETSRERHIRAMSSFAWVQVDRNRCVLSSKEGSIIITQEPSKTPSSKTIDPPATYTITFNRALPPGSKVPYAKTRQIGSASDLPSAIRAADTFATNTFPRRFITTSALWRKQPASETQLKLLNSRLDNENDPLTEADITRGRAADMLTKFKFGAKRQFLKVMAEQRKKETEKAREEVRVERERVRVGPLEV